MRNRNDAHLTAQEQTNTPRPATPFSSRIACRRVRKQLALSLLWRRHLNAEPPDPRPYFIALATCAEQWWQIEALIRFAQRRWPVMAGELGVDGMLRLVKDRYWAKTISNRRFGRMLRVSHDELFAIAAAHGWNVPRQWVRESDRSDRQIAAEARLKKKLAMREKRKRARYWKELLEGGSKRAEREAWCKSTGKSERSWRRLKSREQAGPKPPRITAALIAKCCGFKSTRTFYNRPPEWRRYARALLRDFVAASSGPPGGRWLAHLRVQVSAFCGEHREVLPRDVFHLLQRASEGRRASTPAQVEKKGPPASERAPSTEAQPSPSRREATAPSHAKHRDETEAYRSAKWGVDDASPGRELASTHVRARVRARARAA
jgi:hypothetical protein